MEAGRDEFGFELDNAQDLFVYTGTGRWSEEGSFFGDTVSGFQDGSDLFDLRGSGLQFSDLTIVNEEFQTTITSSRGTITIFESCSDRRSSSTRTISSSEPVQNSLWSAREVPTRGGSSFRATLGPPRVVDATS